MSLKKKFFGLKETLGFLIADYSSGTEEDSEAYLNSIRQKCISQR